MIHSSTCYFRSVSDISQYTERMFFQDDIRKVKYTILLLLGVRLIITIEYYIHPKTCQASVP